MPAGVPPAAQPARHGLRVNLGVAYTLGNYSGDVRTQLNDDRVNLHFGRAIGGNGVTGSAALWYDFASPRALSVGLEYSRGRTSAGIHGVAPNGIDVVDEPVNVDLDARLTQNTVFLNAALFPDRDAAVSPFFGVGIGGGRGSLKVRTAATSNILANGLTLFDVDERFWYPSAQVFLGAQYDLADRLGVEVIGKYVVSTGLPAGIKQTYQQMHLGMGFYYRL
ncbi:outer membrane beta-barrel protein [Azospirillum sp.]|uniref:outer membrane beta-barrel protein n=1 Tax=Azospirillum sp. TaxID=34012 RepID=UPI002D683A58|nr:hypothetical protein [Azospirillum sp.]HYD65651.1 hypothetical protein [Azospirillum sp.]